jgi:uncharacterized protein CbrC (UPF0167 family)
MHRSRVAASTEERTVRSHTVHGCVPAPHKGAVLCELLTRRPAWCNVGYAWLDMFYRLHCCEHRAKLIVHDLGQRVKTRAKKQVALQNCENVGLCLKLEACDRLPDFRSRTPTFLHGCRGMAKVVEHALAAPSAGSSALQALSATASHYQHDELIPVLASWCHKADGDPARRFVQNLVHSACCSLVAR